MMCFKDFKRNITSSFTSSTADKDRHRTRRFGSDSSDSDFSDEIEPRNDVDDPDNDTKQQLAEYRATNKKSSKQSKPQTPLQSSRRMDQVSREEKTFEDRKRHKKMRDNLEEQAAGSLLMQKDTETGANVFVGPGFKKPQVPWKVPVNKVTPEAVALNEKTSLGRRTRNEMRSPETVMSPRNERPSVSIEETPKSFLTVPVTQPIGDISNSKSFHSLLKSKGNRCQRRSTIVSVNDDGKETMSIDSVESIIAALGRSRVDLMSDESDEDLEKDVELQVLRSKSRIKNGPENKE